METAPETVVNDFEIQKKMEDEHLRLQRQVRMTQIEREQKTMGVHPQFRRQDKLLRTLKREYINLIMDLKIARSGAHKKKDKKMRVDLNRALLCWDNTETDCEGGLTIMKQLDGLLTRNSKHMIHLRNLVNAERGQIDERQYQSEMRLVSTENKLETAMLRFNAIQAENQKIREEIGHMLKDRALFNQCWTKMMAALTKGKKFLSDLFESSTLAYDQRDEWCTKLRSMQEKGRMDQLMQVQEMRDLQKALDHEMKLYRFLARKGVIRINTVQELREEENKRKEEEALQAECDKHKNLLHGIYDYTNESADQVIESFEKREQQNFSTYELLTAYCAENEDLFRKLQLIRRDLQDRRDWNEKMVYEYEKKINLKEEQLEKQRERVNQLRKQNAEQDETIRKAVAGMEEMFTMLNCSLEPYQSLLGDKTPTAYHLDLTGRLITGKIKEYIEIIYYYERALKRADKPSTSRLKKYVIHAEPPMPFTSVPIKFLVPADPCPACIEARWLSRINDSLEKPFDKAMVLNAIAELEAEPAFVKSDRIHTLTDCRVPQSRNILAKRYMQN